MRTGKQVVQKTEHSPLGGSGAYRWLKCPGSVKLSHGVEDGDDEFSRPGTQAHSLAEHCLNSGKDAWQFIRNDLYRQITMIGEVSVVVDAEMANAVQVYLNTVRPIGNNDWVELKFHCPEIHEYFWGQSDFVHVHTVKRELHIWDYKHGAGIVVDVKENPQLMYYGVGVLEKLGLWDEVDKVVLHIAQPRGFHFDGPIRSWSISTDELGEWMANELIPAMDRTLVSNELVSGEHCRFCPARRMACPQLLKDFDELEELIVEFSKSDSADELTNEQVGRFLTLFDVAKIVAKAANKTAFNRMSVGGALVPGRKLVKAKSNREWKEDAALAISREFGGKAINPGSLKSPAQIEELPGGKAFAARYAFKPDKGFTLASDADSRPVVARDIKSLFTNVKEKKS